MNREGFNFTDELRQRIFKHFEGMDQEYEELIRNYHKVYLNENYTKEYKDKERILTIDKVKALKADRFDKAKAEIEKIKEEYSAKPEPKKVAPEERAANILLWGKVLPTSTIEEMMELWGDNPSDEDLKRLLKAELRERAAGKTPGPEESKFLHELEHGAIGTRFKEMDKLIPSFNTLSNIDFYPAMIKDSLTGIQYRTVTKDLERYPINDGPTLRPVFSITIHNN